MYCVRISLLLAGILSACFSTHAYAARQAAEGHTHQKLAQPPRPHQRQNLPPSAEQAKYDLAPSSKPRHDLISPTLKSMQPLAATPECKNMDTLASHGGSALANYLVNLPDYECTYPLFSLTPAQGAVVYSSANLDAVVARFATEALTYNASNRALVNLALYLRAGYYLAGGDTIADLPASLTTSLRGPIRQLAEGTVLYAPNPLASTTAAETLRLITNMHDEAYFLPSMHKVVKRYTSSVANPDAAQALMEPAASGGFTSALTVIYYAHFRPDARADLQANGAAYSSALHDFVQQNKAALLNSPVAYQLTDAATESYRFLQYPALKPALRTQITAAINGSSMTGADSGIWLAAASAVKYYDNDNCSMYGTCNYETRLADAVLKHSYTCSPTLRIRAQEMSTPQMQQSCAILLREEGYFHDMMQTGRKPVADDFNAALELVVFDDYANYSKYASVIYDIDTNNGGMYLEGNPATPGNQARFIAHEASWLRPAFTVWNLEHEYVHYLDGRFNLHGDFGAAISRPTVWWLEGLGEYLSLRNNNQKSIDVARRGTYKLSQIFGNTYAMADYTDRAYRWGYMATRFMVERHRNDVDALLAKFRVGDYDGYQHTMDHIGTRYDGEFASWVASATTAGEPPLPVPSLPPCSSTSQLGKNCAIGGFAASTRAYAYILLPAGAKNLRLFTSKGTGDVELYVRLDAYPTTSFYTAASRNVGNAESVSIAAPASGRWYYVMLQAKAPFAGVSLSATYD